MSTVSVPVNKRTVLGGLYWAIGAAMAIASGNSPLTTLLVAVGAYLVFAPRASWVRRARTLEI